MQKLATEGEGEDLYFFRGAFHTPKDMVDPATKSGAFAPIAEQIAADAEKLTDKDENWTKYARKLDRMSLKAYLEQFRGKAEDWAIDLLDVAYITNSGSDRGPVEPRSWWISSLPISASPFRCSARAMRSTASRAALPRSSRP